MLANRDNARRVTSLPENAICYSEEFSGSQEVPTHGRIRRDTYSPVFPPTRVLTWSIMPTTLRIQPPDTLPSMVVVSCVASVRVMMLGMERKTIVFVTWFTRQANLAGNSSEKQRY